METKKVRDHLGYKYDSVSAMCKAHGVLQATYSSRRARGLSIRESLSPKRLNKPSICKDHLGNKYKSKEEMAKCYGIN